MMQSLFITFFSIVFHSHYCASSFIIGDTSLPRKTDTTAVGYDASTDTILLVGGYTTSTDQQFVKFKDHTFTDMGDTYLSSNHYTYGFSQHYTQINNDLWMIDPDGSSFIKFNTETHTAETPPITIPSNVGDDACLTSTDTHLIVIYHTSVQIYSINEDKWLSNIPSLQTSRQQFTCDVVNDKVYAIGGWNGGWTSYDSIEVLDLSNINTISSQSWQYISGELSTGRDAVRSVVYGTDIYVIGGHYSNSFYTDINIIDTTTDECYVGESLAYKASYSTPIIVGNILYVFGGLGSQFPVTYESRYQYSVLPTLTTTTTTTTTTTETPVAMETTLKYVQTTAITDTSIVTVAATTRDTSVTLDTYWSYISDADTLRQSDDIVIIFGLFVLICMIVILLYLFYRSSKQRDRIAQAERGIEPGGAFNINREEGMEVAVVAKESIGTFTSASNGAVNVGKDEFIIHSDSVSVGEAALNDADVANVGNDEFIVREDSVPDGARARNSVSYDAETDEVINAMEGELYAWLVSIDCVQYYNVFVMNGFRSLDFVKEITDIKYLQAMGIMLIGHQLRIVNSIRNLQ